MKIRLLLAIATIVTGCASGPLIKPPLPDASNRAEIVIFRVSSFNSGATNVIVGANEKDYVSIRSGQYASIYLPPANYTFFSRIGDVEIARLDLSLKAGARQCLRIYPYPEGAVVLITPVFMRTFRMEQASCPPDTELSKYERIAIEYER